MDKILLGRNTGQPIKVWIAPGPKRNAIAAVVQDLGGSVEDKAELAQYALVERLAVDLGRVYERLMRDNPEIHILSHKWVYDCQVRKRFVDRVGYEVLRPTSNYGKKSARTPFTPEDDERLVKFLARHAKKRAFLSHLIYEDVAKAYPRHTAMSWRQRFKTNQARLEQEIEQYEAIVQERRDAHDPPYSDEDDENSPPQNSSASIKSSSLSTSRRTKAPKPTSNTRLESTAIPASGRAPLALAPSKKRQSQKGDEMPIQTQVSTSKAFRIDLDGPGERISFSDDDDATAFYETAPEVRNSQVPREKDQPTSTDLPIVLKESSTSEETSHAKRSKVDRIGGQSIQAEANTAATRLSTTQNMSSIELPATLEDVAIPIPVRNQPRKKTALTSLPLPAGLFDETIDGMV